ncbi:FG-GAP-like repeat-containing protein [Embleya sp. NBC_00896]|uniref:FG-GAP-like repeat-containing protein n=1 Tax=Embleya sp. NBC_00896 TaxID=2975961 RepID=UPI00386BFBC9|nr:FG-GAP-like repeat-containing protein [Embleya sp. NBC_00896]
MAVRRLRLAWPGKRVGVGVAAAVALAVGAGGVVVVVDDDGDGRKKTGPAAARPVESAVTIAETKAQKVAAATGKPVLVAETLTATGTTHANPDGTFTRDEGVKPVRVKRDGQWVAIDATLVPAADGSLTTRATSVGLRFAGAPARAGAAEDRAGRAAARTTAVATVTAEPTPATDVRLLEMSVGASRFAMHWPGPLPEPIVRDSRVLYPEVLPGADLVLTATDNGFSQVIVVKSREAAADPKLAELGLRLSSADLRFTIDDAHVVRAVDAAGREVAAAPTPYMWDSSGHPQTAPTAGLDLPGLGGPEQGSRDALVGTRLDADTLRLTPDQKLLSAPETTYPVFIDPSFNGQTEAWTLAYKTYAGSSFWNGANFNGGTDDARAGHESQSNGTSQSFFRVDWDENGMRNVAVQSATFRVMNHHSWSCNKREVELWLTAPISSATTWNNRPGDVVMLDKRNEAHGYNASCPGDYIGFNAKNAAERASAAGWPDITMGIRATDQNDAYAWKKFRDDPVLSVVYNRPPNQPIDPTLTPGGPCTTNAPFARIGLTDVRLTAQGSDPDGNLDRIWLNVWRTGTSDYLFADYLWPDSRGVITYDIRAPRFVDGATYSWNMQARDTDGAVSDLNGKAGGSIPCQFTVDQSAPSAPEISSPQFPAGKDGDWVAGAEFGTTGDFTFKSGDGSDVVEYAYSLDTTSFTNRAKPNSPGGVATLKIIPPHAGPTVLYVKAKDAVGNYSTQTAYTFFVEPRDTVDGPMDFTGDQKPDLAAVDGAGNLRVYPSFSGGRLNESLDAAGVAEGKVPAGYWTNALVTYNGDYWGGDGLQDVIARMPDGRLWIYPGNGRGGVEVGGRMELRLPAGAPAPSTFTQILSLGDASGDGHPDLMAVDAAGTLYALTGYTGGTIDKVESIGGGGWQNYTIHGAGDITGDGAVDLIARTIAGDGKLWVYKGVKEGNGTRLSSLGASGSRFEYGASGWQKGQIAEITALPDVTADGIPDLWVLRANGDRLFYPGLRTEHGGATNATGETSWDHCQEFASPGGGTQRVCGPILTKYLDLAGPYGFAGAPTTGVNTVPDGTGRYTHFANNASIYWSPYTGAWAVNGGIRTRWSELGWERGRFGYPNSDEFDVAGGRRSSFQNGYIRWNEATQTATEHDPNDRTQDRRWELAGDVNDDGFADVVTVYDYGLETTAFFVSSGNANGTLEAPYPAWTSHIGWFGSKYAKYVIGDFNGDGRADVGALYGYPDGSNAWFTFAARDNGTFEEGVRSAYVAPGNWEWWRATALAGDYNGDGVDDVAMVYDHGNGVASAHTFIGNRNGEFNAPFQSWKSNPGWWWSGGVKYISGDFDGNGRDDIAGFYGYGNNTSDAVALHTLLSKPDGGFNAPFESWRVPAGNWDWTRAKLTSGDYNGDGRADAAAMYDYGGGESALFTFIARADGGFAQDVRSWKSANGTWWGDAARPVSGDFNGDGRTDIAAMYNSADGSSGLHTFPSTADGLFPGFVNGWQATPGTW